MLQSLKNIDIQLLLYVNGHHAPFWDQVMWFASGKFSWIPLYLFLAILIVYKLRYKAIPMLLLIGVLILLSDQLASGLIKPLVHRLRPSHETGLYQLLHFVNGYKGGRYGFVSSHAINVFALSFYLSFTLKRQIKWLPYLLFLWAILVAYSRVYLGVHYPSDVIVPVFLSMPIAYLISIIYFRIEHKYWPPKQQKHDLPKNFPV